MCSYHGLPSRPHVINCGTKKKSCLGSTAVTKPRCSAGRRPCIMSLGYFFDKWPNKLQRDLIGGLMVIIFKRWSREEYRLHIWLQIILRLMASGCRRPYYVFCVRGKNILRLEWLMGCCDLPNPWQKAMFGLRIEDQRKMELSAGPILWIMRRSQGSIIKNTSPELHKCLVQGGRRVENLKAHLPC